MNAWQLCNDSISFEALILITMFFAAVLWAAYALGQMHGREQGDRAGYLRGFKRGYDKACAARGRYVVGWKYMLAGGTNESR